MLCVHHALVYLAPVLYGSAADRFWMHVLVGVCVVSSTRTYACVCMVFVCAVGCWRRAGSVLAHMGSENWVVM